MININIQCSNEIRSYLLQPYTKVNKQVNSIVSYNANRYVWLEVQQHISHRCNFAVKTQLQENNIQREK
jgi:hypothetical protein